MHKHYVMILYPPYYMHFTRWLQYNSSAVLTRIKLSLFLVRVSFVATAYTVTEGRNTCVELILVRSGYINRTATVTLYTLSRTAVGMSIYPPPCPLHKYVVISLTLLLVHRVLAKTAQQGSPPLSL